MQNRGYAETLIEEACVERFEVLTAVTLALFLFSIVKPRALVKSACERT
jgi:hypothetical protein